MAPTSSPTFRVRHMYPMQLWALIPNPASVSRSEVPGTHSSRNKKVLNSGFLKCFSPDLHEIWRPSCTSLETNAPKFSVPGTLWELVHGTLKFPNFWKIGKLAKNRSISELNNLETFDPTWTIFCANNKLGALW